MKVTIRAVLININGKHKQAIDELMTAFCSAVRYSFKRLLEGIKIGEIEKNVSYKYGLNIRQSKDAVENARQIITSQKELVKMNYENTQRKVSSIEKDLQRENLSERKRKALTSKLEKRKRRLIYLESFISSNKVPPVVFGTREKFIRRCKGLITHEEWVDARSNRIYSRGDKTKKGNPNLRVVIHNCISYLEVSTLEKTETNRAVKVKVPIYLPQKLSKKTGKVNGIAYRELFLNHLSVSDAYQVEIIRKDGMYYCHIAFDVPRQELKYTVHTGSIGVDTNPDGFALTVIDRQGNYKKHYYLKQHELLYARTERRKNLCGELVKKVVDIAKEKALGIAIEELKFKDDQDVKNKFARNKHQFIYSKLLAMLESACIRQGVEVNKVKPQYTSKIGLYKYCHQYGMDVHNGAAMVIARRSYGYKEKIPKLLRDIFIKEKDAFIKQNEWKRWAIINKNIDKSIEGKEVNKPDFWIDNRKEILGVKLLCNF